MLISIECNTIENAMELGNKYIVFLCERHLGCSMLYPDTKYRDSTLVDFKHSTHLGESQVYARLLDFISYSDRARETLKKQDVVICINYLLFHKNEPRLHGTGPQPDLVFHVLDDADNVNDLNNERYNVNNQTAMKRFCAHNGLDYVPIIPGDHVDIRMMFVMLKSPGTTLRDLELTCQFTKEERRQMQVENQQTLGESAAV